MFTQTIYTAHDLLLILKVSIIKCTEIYECRVGISEYFSKYFEGGFEFPKSPCIRYI